MPRAPGGKAGLAVALVAASLLAAPAQANEDSAARERLARHEAGRAIYNFRCYFCHGYSGDARTLAATYLVPPPRNFAALPADGIAREGMLSAVRDGLPGTAMKGFANILDEDEIARVVDFVRLEFMQRKAVNTRYHTAENGWPEHDRNRVAFPFAKGEIALDTPWEALTEEQLRGKRLFLASCITCHDHGRTEDPGVTWEGRPVSYPRNSHEPGVPERPPTSEEAISSASPYLVHDVIPSIEGLTPEEKLGEDLFQRNCAFCHAADGTGKNWIGSFMEPHPRNLTDPSFMADMTRQRLAATIRDGLPNTSMPAWKHVLDGAQIDAVVAYVNKAFHPLAD
ncbi:MAG: c-type cytochrome [Rhodocyclaceae bacterium]|nr:c-type cytochrome [Rhodocyclaceae bacterium]